MKTILCTLMLTSAAMLTYGQEKSIPLYSNGIPNSKSTPGSYIEKTDQQFITLVSVPAITPYLPEKGKANGTAIIIFPGGGYSGQASEHEGKAIALAFNKIGVAAFILKYRLPSDLIMVDKTIGPLQDAQQAILTVRKRAAEWGLMPDKIGIIGFSAGGHLASTLGTHFDKVLIDNKENISVRPDFMMLIYPVITFGTFAHVGSRENLIGKNPPPEQLTFFSSEKQVSANTPPTFLVHAQDDDAVPVQNSLLFYDALLNVKVKTEMHLFQEGGHGFGLNNPKSKGKWFDWAKNWLYENGF